MLPNDDLARWGEPPADEHELALAELLAEVLHQDGPTGRTLAVLPPDLVDVCRRIDEMMTTVSAVAGVTENLPPPADAGGQAQAIDLRLSVSRLASGSWRPVASTRPVPCVVRDLRRVPEGSDRVPLRTGERVRVEVVCDREGHLLVFNVGPRGGVNILYPERAGEAGALRAGEPVQILDVELISPAGRERLYAVWSRTPLLPSGARVRDMRRVEEALAELPPGNWHAVVLELDHAE